MERMDTDENEVDWEAEEGARGHEVFFDYGKAQGIFGRVAAFNTYPLYALTIEPSIKTTCLVDDINYQYLQ